MPVQLLINLLIAFLWMFLQDSWNFISFLGGYLVGLFILFSMRRFYKERYYLITLLAVIKLVIVFISELISSSVLVVRQIMKPKLDITPGIFKMNTELETDTEVALLSLLLTLTPGSVVMEITPDGKTLYIHALDIPESSDAVIKSTKVFEKAIKDVTRYV